MAHELSHVLLRSLFHPKWDSELHTDLVPVLLGFHESVRKGRTTSHVKTNGNIKTTTTTTYGYLTNSQFEFACRKVTDILKLHQGKKEHLLGLITKVRDKLDRAVNRLAHFRDYLTYLDSHLPEDMTGEDARSVVKLHEWNYTSGWERGIGRARTSLRTVDPFAQTLHHFTGNTVQQLKDCTLELEMASKEVSQLTEAISRDLSILKKYVGLVYRARSWMHRRR